MEAGQEQVERSLLGMPSCMSKYRCFRVRISLLTSKIISGTWRLILEASQVQIGRILLGMLLCMSKYRFVGVRILILISKVMSGTRGRWKLILEACSGQA